MTIGIVTGNPEPGPLLLGGQEVSRKGPQMADTAKVEERENGPLVVKGLRRMVDADGSEIEVKEVMRLCRCGHSAQKPFCDGSHARVGFESRGGTPTGLDRVITYSGAEISVTFNPRLCAHAGECGRIAKHVFNPSQKPWVQPDKGSVEEIQEVIASCPSGALALRGIHGPEHMMMDRPDIQVQKNGPYWVLEVEPPVPPQAEGMSPEKYVLCRCGQSGNKPFCDGTHFDVGWKDD